MWLSPRSGLGRASQVTLVIKTPPANAKNVRDTGLIPGLGRSPGRGQGNPLQCPCLENPMDREAWRATVQGLRVRHDWSDLAYMHAGLGNPVLRAGLKLPLASEGPHRCPSHATKDCYPFSCWQCLRLPFFPPIIFISWRLITLQYCSSFCHTLT